MCLRRSSLSVARPHAPRAGGDAGYGRRPGASSAPGDAASTSCAPPGDGAAPAEVDVAAVGQVEPDDVDDRPAGAAERLGEPAHLWQRGRHPGDLEGLAVER